MKAQARDAAGEAIALDIDGVHAALNRSVSKQLIRLLIQKGELPATRFGNRVLVMRRDLDAYLERRSTIRKQIRRSVVA